MQSHFKFERAWSDFTGAGWNCRWAGSGIERSDLVRLWAVERGSEHPRERGAEILTAQLRSHALALTECGRPDCSLPRQGFEILHWPFSQFSAIDPAFGCYGGCTKGRAVSKQSLSHWIVDAISEAYTTQGLENALCTLGAVQRGLSFHLNVIKMYVYSRYLLGSRLVFAE